MVKFALLNFDYPLTDNHLHSIAEAYGGEMISELRFDEVIHTDVSVVPQIQSLMSTVEARLSSIVGASDIVVKLPTSPTLASLITLMFFGKYKRFYIIQYNPEGENLMPFGELICITEKSIVGGVGL